MTQLVPVQTLGELVGALPRYDGRFVIKHLTDEENALILLLPPNS